MKKLIAVAVLMLAVAGCSNSIAPVRTYEPEWCKVSEFVTPEGDHLFVYSSPRGSSMELKSSGAKGEVKSVEAHGNLQAPSAGTISQR